MYKHDKIDSKSNTRQVTPAVAREALANLRSRDPRELQYMLPVMLHLRRLHELSIETCVTYATIKYDNLNGCPLCTASPTCTECPWKVIHTSTGCQGDLGVWSDYNNSTTRLPDVNLWIRWYKKVIAENTKNSVQH